MYSCPCPPQELSRFIRKKETITTTNQIKYVPNRWSFNRAIEFLTHRRNLIFRATFVHVRDRFKHTIWLILPKKSTNVTKLFLWNRDNKLISYSFFAIFARCVWMCFDGRALAAYKVYILIWFVDKERHQFGV